eukprot:54334-Eustigmatos_ZCMA.PRE.1
MSGQARQLTALQPHPHLRADDDFQPQPNHNGMAHERQHVTHPSRRPCSPLRQTCSQGGSHSLASLAPPRC